MDEETLNKHFLILVARTGIVFNNFSDLKTLHPQDFEELVNFLKANLVLLLTSSNRQVREITAFLVNKRKLIENA